MLIIKQATRKILKASSLVKATSNIITLNYFFLISSKWVIRILNIKLYNAKKIVKIISLVKPTNHPFYTYSKNACQWVLRMLDIKLHARNKKYKKRNGQFVS